MVGEAAGATEETGPEVVAKGQRVEVKTNSTVNCGKMGQARLSLGRAGGPDIRITPPTRVAEVTGGLVDKLIFVLTVIHAPGRTD